MYCMVLLFIYIFALTSYMNSTVVINKQYYENHSKH